MLISRIMVWNVAKCAIAVPCTLQWRVKGVHNLSQLKSMNLKTNINIKNVSYQSKCLTSSFFLLCTIVCRRKQRCISFSSYCPPEGTHLLTDLNWPAKKKNEISHPFLNIPHFLCLCPSATPTHLPLSGVGRLLFRFPNCSRNLVSHGRAAPDRGQ